MGFSTLLDILGSTVIGGLLLMILLRMNDAAIENNYTFNGEKIVQQNLVELVKLLEYDFRKIGYCSDETQITNPADAIIYASEDTISFQTDIVTSPGTFGDGILDTLSYFLSPDSTLISTPNPNDKLLYRYIKGQPLRGSNLGVTQFKLTYFDAFGNLISYDTLSNRKNSGVPLGIISLQIDITMENPYSYNEDYGDDYGSDKKVIWRQIRLAARNFRTR